MTQTLTRKGRATRDRIVAGAAAEMRERGVATTTLDDVLARTGTSRSRLFHDFPAGREQLLQAVAEHEAARVLSDQQPHQGSLDSWATWQAWRDAVVDRYRGQGQQCPLNVLVTQLGRSTLGAQAVTAQLLGSWQSQLAAGIHGGVLVMLSTGDLSNLEAALDVGIEYLRAAAGPPAGRRTIEG